MKDTRRQVVVAGAGVAGLETALALQALAPQHVSVELIAPEDEFVYRPLAVAEPFQVGEVRRFPLARLVADAGAELRSGAVAAVDPDEKQVALSGGSTVEYDVLVLALGARPIAAVPGALTFRGSPDDGAELAGLLERVAAGELRRLVFAVPSGSTWPLPLYELALLTGEYLAEHLTHAELTVVTPEEQPLALFGTRASEAMAMLLETRGIGLRTATSPVAFEDGVLRSADGSGVAADAVVALPKLEGPRLDGIPQDEHGFVPTDEFGRVADLTDVYAAGDLMQSSVKQGGVAAQEADAVAAAIAADAGAPVESSPCRPVLRGLLLTGFVPRFLRNEEGGPSLVDTQPLWWPPGKIVGRYLSPFLAEHLGLSTAAEAPPADALPIEVAVDRPAWTPI
ncbi:MAG: NAD(P)/FAD-dependent oxidoreductase [Gaiellaceae bacterium]